MKFKDLQVGDEFMFGGNRFMKTNNREWEAVAITSSNKGTVCALGQDVKVERVPQRRIIE